MIYQLYHQNKTDRNEIKFCSQKKIDLGTKSIKFRGWVVETQRQFPVPEGFEWLCYNEDSEYFNCTKKEKEYVKINTKK